MWYYENSFIFVKENKLALACARVPIKTCNDHICVVVVVLFNQLINSVSNLDNLKYISQ